MMEVWRDIKDYEGSYQVSDHGRVRGLDRVVKHPRGGLRRWEGRVLKPKLHPGGYLMVSLCNDGDVQSRLIHRLVLEAFVGAAPGGCECNHISGDKTENRIGNLEWVSASENMQHAYQAGLNVGPPALTGEDHYNAKLSPEIAELVRRIYAIGEHTQKQIGLMFGVGDVTISRVIRGESWAS